MKSPSKKPHDILNEFEDWLARSPIQARPEALSRILASIQEPALDLDEAVDQLLKPNPRLYSPHLLARIRNRLQDSKASTTTASWFQWMVPLSAAAVLTLAFFSFQTTAPDSVSTIAGNQTVISTKSESIQEDTELTRIFALATNLHATTDMSRLQSVDDLAFLFE